MEDNAEELPKESAEITPISSAESKKNNEDDLFKVPHGLISSKNKNSVSQNALNSSKLADPAELPQLNYTVPDWACEPPPEMNYGFDVIKSGTLLETIEFSKRRFPTYIVIGRLDVCDIQMNHPSISRYHCILQYGNDIMNRTEKGWHLYDLGSTHGTKLNKRRIPPEQYIRIRVGHVMQLGGSTRILNLVGPSSDTEAELDSSLTELRKMKEEKRLLKEEKTNDDTDVLPTTSESNTESFYDSDDEEYLYAKIREDYESDKNEEKYQKDPLKVLSHFFEQEGFEMNFSFTEVGTGSSRKWFCTIELPVDTATGQSLSASATCEGGKKNAQIACALDACRVLDMHGVLYRGTSMRKKAEKILAENDYYDSDEDPFLDRTGQIEKSRENRKRRAMEAQGKVAEEVYTYDSLLEKIAVIEEEMKAVGKSLSILSGTKSDTQNFVVDDDLDAYCRKLGSASQDSLSTRTEKSQLRLRLTELEHEKERLKKLAKIVKPVSLPELLPAGGSSTKVNTSGRTAGVAAVMKKIMQMRRNKEKTTESHSPENNVLDAANDAEKPFVIEEDDVEKPEHSPNQDLPSTSIAGGDEGVGIKSALDKNSLNEADATSTCVKVGAADIENNFTSATKDDLLAQDHVGQKTSEIRSNNVSSKKRRVRTRCERGEKKAAYDEQSLSYSDDYITWMPPEAQTGDGRTSLNDKFAGKY
uniref:FHA domain-containing protein n=1 Tax=Syphacia muris TaxID=451379 RepID=A0A0N5AJ71_9BILA